MRRQRGDRLGHWLAAHVTPALNETARRWRRCCMPSRGATGEAAEPTHADQRCPGKASRPSRPRPRPRGIRLEVVRLPEAKRGVAPPPRRAVERAFAGAARLCRPLRDQPRPPETLRAPHLIALACPRPAKGRGRPAQRRDRPYLVGSRSDDRSCHSVLNSEQLPLAAPPQSLRARSYQAPLTLAQDRRCLARPRSRPRQ